MRNADRLVNAFRRAASSWSSFTGFGSERDAPTNPARNPKSPRPIATCLLVAVEHDVDGARKVVMTMLASENPAMVSHDFLTSESLSMRYLRLSAAPASGLGLSPRMLMLQGEFSEKSSCIHSAADIVMLFSSPQCSQL